MSGSLPPSPAAEEGRLWAAPASGQPGPTRGATEALTQRPRLLHSLRSEPPLLQPPSLLSRRSQQCPAGALRQLPVNQGTAGRGSGPVSRGWGARGGVCVGGVETLRELLLCQSLGQTCPPLTPGLMLPKACVLLCPLPCTQREGDGQGWLPHCHAPKSGIVERLEPQLEPLWPAPCGWRAPGADTHVTVGFL